MTDIIKCLTVQRGKTDDLRGLLTRKGFWNDYDGWKGAVKSYGKISPTQPREIEVVFFRPTQEEHSHNRDKVPAVFVQRILKPASLFEVLNVLPDHKGYDSRKSVFEEFGDDFIMFAHGHTSHTFVGYQPAYIEGQYGSRLTFRDGGILVSHTKCWYAGYRKVSQAVVKAAEG